MEISVTPARRRPAGRYGLWEKTTWLWSVVDTSTRNPVVVETGASESYGMACESAMKAFNDRMFGKENG